MTTTSHSRSAGVSYSIGHSASEGGPEDARYDADGVLRSADADRIAIHKLLEDSAFLGVWPRADDSLATFAERALAALDQRVDFLNVHVRAALLAAMSGGAP